MSKREDTVCNFLEYPGSFLIDNANSDCKLIYRHYATLYFVFCVDSSESELGILDLIQVFVETLDKLFTSVCELDLIFHADSVHFILNELVMGGMVLQTNMNEIIARVEEQNKLQKAEAGMSVNTSASRAVSAMKNINLPQIKDKVLDLPDKFRDFKFWPRALDSVASPTAATQLDTTSLSAFKLDTYHSDGGYTELKWNHLCDKIRINFNEENIYWHSKHTEKY